MTLFKFSFSKMSQVRDITFCKVCPYKGTYLLKHLVGKNACKKSYTEEEILEIKKSSKAITSKNTAFKKRQKYNSVTRAKRYQEEKKKTIGKKQIISIEVKIQSWKVLQKEVADQNMLYKEKAMKRFGNLISMEFSQPYQKDLEILKVEATTMEKNFQIEMKEATKRTLEIIGSQHLESPTREVATIFQKLLEKMKKNWKDINAKISEVLNATIVTYIKKLGMI